MGYARITIILVLLFAVGLMFTSAIHAGNYPGDSSADDAQVIKKVPGRELQVESDYLDVIITFKDNVKVESKGITALSENAKDIKTIPMEIKHNLPIINAVSATIHKDELEAIQNLPYVASVEMNEKRYVMLNDTIPLINADDVQNSTLFPPNGYNGSGVKVCILDTGYDFFHESLPTPTESVDFTTWDYYIDGSKPPDGTGTTFNYSLNVTNLSLDVVTFEVNWIYSDNRFDLYVYYPNGTLANNTIGLNASNDTCIVGDSYCLDINVSDVGDNLDNYTFVLNETNTTKTSGVDGTEYATIIWSPSFVNIHPQDDYGHGTHVAGIIASNNTTYKGVAPNIDLYIAKVLDTDGAGYTSSIVAGIDWCVEQEVDIISMSLGGYTNTSTNPTTWDDYNYNCNTSDANAVDNATLNYGILSVVAAGNCGTTSSTCPFTGDYSIASPGCARTALTIGATNKSDVITTFSSLGPTNDLFARIKPEIVSPGVGIYSTIPTNNFESMSGTSQATPHVAGVAALLKQYHPDWTAQMLKVALINSANQSALGIGISGNDYGFGRVDALSAVNTTYVDNTSIVGTNTTVYKLNVSSADALKVTIYWDENSSEIHNKIYLNLTAPNGTIVSSDMDNNNSVQQVAYESPGEGIWTAAIISNNTSAKQVYIASNHDIIQSFNYSIEPNITIIAPNSTEIYSSPAIFNVTITTITEANTSHIWWSIDNSTNSTPLALNDSLNYNGSITWDFPGEHTFNVYVNDTLANFGSSSVTFYANETIDFPAWISDFETYASVTNTNVFSELVNYTSNTSTNPNALFNISFETTNFNVTLFNLNGTTTAWEQMFNVFENSSEIESTIIDLGSNATQIFYAFDVDNFGNHSGSLIKDATDFTEIFYCVSDSNCSTISYCEAYSGIACYNNTTESITVWVSHFSAIAFGDDTNPPSITINSPISTNYTNSNATTIYNMPANISFPIDTTYCNYSLKNMTNVLINYESIGYETLSQNTNHTWYVGPLKNGRYNITFGCKDLIENYNNITLYFNISDKIGPEIDDTSEENETDDSGIILINTSEPTNYSVTLYTDVDCDDTFGEPETSGYDDDEWQTEHEVEFNGLDSASKYYYRITVWDYQGNKTIEDDDDCEDHYLKTLLEDDGGNEGSEGGTDGTTTNTTASMKETHFWDAIAANSEITMDVKSSAIVIDFIKFMLDESVVSAQMSAQSYGTTVPPGLLSAPNFVYQYFDISSTFSNSLKIMRINLKIPKSWFTTNNYDPTKVEIYHYKNNSWVNEFTEDDGLSGDYYTYHAEVTSLSKFALSTVEAPPYVESCGNGVCNQTSAENCSTCEADCGPCSIADDLNATSNITTNQTNKKIFTFPKVDLEWAKQNKYLILGAVLIAVFLVLAYLVKTGKLPEEFKMPKMKKPKINIQLPRPSRSKEKIQAKPKQKEKNLEFEPGQFRLR